ncbi:unnamed protein product [Symbiodinium natans]|uniref:Uncharacterized protein n=1 Tax=Symbiodinium natans TaxID=878477 RepID=A0A812QVC9_9DINO|nr:unnamed protein product [Symbiodinium natans]
MQGALSVSAARPRTLDQGGLLSFCRGLQAVRGCFQKVGAMTQFDRHQSQQIQQLCSGKQRQQLDCARPTLGRKQPCKTLDPESRYYEAVGPLPLTIDWRCCLGNVSWPN